MAKKKSKTTTKTGQKRSWWSSVVIVLLKSPYYLYIQLKRLVSFLTRKHQEHAVKRRRRSMEYKYQRFNVIQIDAGNFQAWEQYVHKNDSSIGIIVGGRGSGKTAFGISMLENIHANTGRSCFAMGFNEAEMPAWITCIDDINAITNNSFVLLDEGGIFFSARRAMRDVNVLLSELLLIARHKNLSILFIAQNSANLDVNIIRQADYLVLKRSSLLQKDFERKIFQKLYTDLESGFKKYKEIKGIAYIYADDFRGFVETPLPSFWNVKISKSFGQTTVGESAKDKNDELNTKQS